MATPQQLLKMLQEFSKGLRQDAKQFFELNNQLQKSDQFLDYTFRAGLDRFKPISELLKQADYYRKGYNTPSVPHQQFSNQDVLQKTASGEQFKLPDWAKTFDGIRARINNPNSAQTPKNMLSQFNKEMDKFEQDFKNKLKLANRPRPAPGASKKIRPEPM